MRNRKLKFLGATYFCDIPLYLVKNRTRRSHRVFVYSKRNRFENVKMEKEEERLKALVSIFNNFHTVFRRVNNIISKDLLRCDLLDSFNFLGGIYSVA